MLPAMQASIAMHNNGKNSTRIWPGLDWTHNNVFRMVCNTENDLKPLKEMVITLFVRSSMTTYKCLRE